MLSLNYIKKPEPVRPADQTDLERSVRAIIECVRDGGDGALRAYSREFDAIELENLEFTQEEIERAGFALDSSLISDMRFVIERVEAFARAQLASISPLEVEILPGIHLGHRLIPIERVGIYVPGGRFPLLSSPQMGIIPARVAGCAEIYVCTPPKAHPAVIYAAHLSGATKIFRIGGAQAIAALAHGTETVPQVDKIAGPGNKYVNEAKRQIIGQVGIDQLAGPSEIFTLADDSADPKMIAADLLAQAEHDPDTRVGLITTSEEIGRATLLEINRQLRTLKTANIAGASWNRRGEIVVCNDEAEMIAYSDYIAAEHLQVHTKDADATAHKLRHYGSLFIGQNASVVFSDKACGTNHILPTGRAGRYTGGVWVGTFLKVCTHQRIEQTGVNILAPLCARQSAREGLDGHQRAAELRVNYDAI
ncbi:MAG: sulfopropanediol 3-dehydrogenase [Acidobacteriaceae bacterium]|nr:sulfopropanediol 3-dehydrogenase [Acidobacteriaceae bacterium]